MIYELERIRKGNDWLQNKKNLEAAMKHGINSD